MAYLLAFIFPPAACLVVGRPGAAVLNCFLTLFIWIPGVIHALLVVGNATGERRHREMVREMKRRR